jgi:hypothetical protein
MLSDEEKFNKFLAMSHRINQLMERIKRLKKTKSPSSNCKMSCESISKELRDFIN